MGWGVGVPQCPIDEQVPECPVKEVVRFGNIYTAGARDEVMRWLLADEQRATLVLPREG